MITKNILLSATIASLSFGAILASEGNMSHQYPFAFPTAQEAFHPENIYIVSNEAQVVRANGHYQYENLGTMLDAEMDLDRYKHETAVACSALLLVINGDCARYDRFQELVAQHGTTDLSHLCPEFAKQKTEAEEAVKNLLGENGAGQQNLDLLEKLEAVAVNVVNDIPIDLTGTTSTENLSEDKIGSTEAATE